MSLNKTAKLRIIARFQQISAHTHITALPILPSFTATKAESSYMHRCLAIQVVQYFSQLDCSLSSDLAAKTVASAFHLHNVSAHRKLQVCL